MEIYLGEPPIAAGYAGAFEPGTRVRKLRTEVYAGLRIASL